MTPMIRSTSSLQEKRSLAAILREKGALSVTDAIDVVLDVCDELANAHQNGVVHGDLGIHRVRTAWPRFPGDPLDIYALGETDTAAFEVRASAGSILVAPEQRDGRIVDARADIFAVGVMLHWLISGRPPGIISVSRMLESVAGPVVKTIEACLCEDPAGRPQSIDEVAATLGSFATSPPERFAQVARRQHVVRAPKRGPVLTDQQDETLGRLDDVAYSRELSAITQAPKSIPQETLVISVHSVFSQPPRPIDPEVRRASYAPPSVQAPVSAPVPAYPHGYPDESYGPASYRHAPNGVAYGDVYGSTHHAEAHYAEPPYAYAQHHGEPAWSEEGYGYAYTDPAASGHAHQRVASTPPVSFETPSIPPPPPRSPWTSVFGFIATAAVVAFAVLIIARLTDRRALEQAAAAQTAAAAAVQTPAAPATAPLAQPSAPVLAPSSAVTPTPSTPPTAPKASAQKKAEKAELPAVAPSALPDARPAKSPRTGPSRGASARGAVGRGKSSSGPRAASGVDVPTSREAPADDSSVVSPGSVLTDALR
jgi:hypothetical protein